MWRVSTPQRLRQGGQLATRLHAADPGVRMVFLLAPGIDIANDQVLAGIEAVLGPEVTIFGATASDNMRGLATYQAVDAPGLRARRLRRRLFRPHLEVDTQATHGFVASGEPLRVTRLGRQPDHHTRRPGLPGKPTRPAWVAGHRHPGRHHSHRCPGRALAPELAAEYGNDHLLRVVTHREADGVIVHPAPNAPGAQSSG